MRNLFISKPTYEETPHLPEEKKRDELLIMQSSTPSNKQGYFSRYFINMLFLSILLIVVAVLYGAGQGNSVPMNEAIKANQELLEQVRTLNAASIFLNNCLIALVSLTPGIGSIFMLYVMHNSGFYIGMIAKASGYSAIDAVLITFLNPVGILEIVAYTIALGESILLLYLLIMKRMAEFKKRILTNSWKTVIAIVGLLIVAAIIEASLLGL